MTLVTLWLGTESLYALDFIKKPKLDDRQPQGSTYLHTHIPTPWILFFMGSRDEHVASCL